MKKLISPILILSLTLSFFSFNIVMANDIVIFYEDFENGLKNWTIPSGMEAKFVTTGDDVKSGKASLKVTDDMNAATSTNYYSQRFEAIPGMEYKLSSDIKLLEGDEDAGRVYLRFNTADGKPALSKAIPGGNAVWATKSGTYIAPDNAAYGLVIIASISNATGKVLIDNIKVSIKEPSGEASAEDTDTAPLEQTDFTSEALKNLSASDPINLCSPIADIQILACHTDTEKNIFYGVTSGTPAILFALNLDTKEIIDVKELRETKKDDKSKVCYGVDMGANGILNITTQSGNALFFRYNTVSKELKCYGSIFGETAVMSSGYVDPDDNYYFGSYPSAKLLKYDKKADKLIDLGNVIGGKYARAIGGYKEKVFIGGLGSPTAEFVKYDTKTGKVTTLPNPSLSGVFEKDDVESYYMSFCAGKYYFAKCKVLNEKINAYYVCVLDMETEKWVGFVEKSQHQHFTPFEGDVVYYHKTITPGIAGLFSYNPETNESKHIEGFDSAALNGYLVFPTFVTLKDQKKYPGRTIVAGGNTKGIVLINMENKKVEIIKDILPMQTTPIRTLKKGVGNELVLSAYMGSKFVVYDTKLNKVKYEAASTQAESIRTIDGKYYLGLYGTNAGLREYDPSLPPSTDNPKVIAEMKGAEQNRAFNIADAGDKIVWGSFPDYGKLGGAVAVYDKATKAVSVYKEPVKNQCIGGLAYKDGKIYGSTSVYGGLGSEPVDAPAKLFIMDINTGKVEKEVDVNLSTDTNRQYYVGDMVFDKNGGLWVACVKTLIKVNPETLEIEKEIPIGKGKNTLRATRGPCYVLEIGEDGLLYTTIGGRVSAVDLDTCEVKTILNKFTNSMTVGNDGNIYIMNHYKSDELHKVTLTRSSKIYEASGKSVSLFIGSPNALVYGDKTLIDKANEKVIASTVNGRTLVPVRFIAESYGAEVGWDDLTQTVTLKMSDKTVTIVLNKNEIDINGEKITIDVPAQTLEGRTMLPLRAFVEKVMGKTVFWDDRGLIVITDNPLLDTEKDKDAVDSLIKKIK